MQLANLPGSIFRPCVCRLVYIRLWKPLKMPSGFSLVPFSITVALKQLHIKESWSHGVEAVQWGLDSGYAGRAYIYYY